MTDEDSIVSCSACGTSEPRSAMFGIEPDLLCARCASGVRRRMHVRFRPLAPDRKPVMTVICLAIAVVLFVAERAVSGREPGGARPQWLLALYQMPEIWVGEVWRHVSCMFLHAAWWHIGMNGFALWFLGRHMEMGWSPWAVLGVLLGTGVAASALEWIMQGGGVGLSGGLFGMCGFLWALRRVHPIAAAIMNEQMIRWILTLLVIGVVLSATGQLAIGNWAHGGGLAMGYLFGVAVKHPMRRVLVPLSSVVIVVLVVASIYIALGTVQLTEDGGETYRKYPRSEWREIYLEQHAARNARGQL